MSKKYTANLYDSCLRIMEYSGVCNTFYYILNVNDKFDIELFKRSYIQVKKDISILSCKLSRGIFRDKWIPVKGDDGVQTIQSIPLKGRTFDSEGEFFEEAYNHFAQLKDKHINILEESPLKIKIIENDQNGCKMIAFCVHHCLADGRGWLQVIKTIGEYYRSSKNRTTYKAPKNTRNMSKLVFSISREDFKKAIQSLKNKPKTDPIEALVEMDNVDVTDFDANDVVMSKVTINKNQLNQLKEHYKAYNFTVNELFQFLILRIVHKYNMALEKPNAQMGTGMMVDLRRYLKEDVFSITNYFAPDPIMINTSDMDDINRVNQIFKDLKKKPLGLGFLYPILVFGIFPVFILEKIMGKLMKYLAIQSYSGLTITNFGKMDDYVAPFAEGVVHLSAIPSTGVHGFPAMIVSGYKEDLTIYLIKYKDDMGITKKIRAEFIDMINEILTTDKIK